MLGQRAIPDSQWFAREPRSMRAGAFPMMVRLGTKIVPVLGTLASRFGVAFISEFKIDGPELTINMTIRSRTIPSRVRIVAQDEVRHKDKNVLRYFTQLVGIAADDWDALVRYVDDLPEPPPPAARPAAADEDFRSLPLGVQRAIVGTLARARRVAPPDGDTAPLIRFNRIATRTVGDTTYTDIVVHSRILIDGETKRYNTGFRLFPDGRIEERA